MYTARVVPEVNAQVDWISIRGIVVVFTCTGELDVPIRNKGFRKVSALEGIGGRSSPEKWV